MARVLTVLLTISSVFFALGSAILVIGSSCP